MKTTPFVRLITPRVWAGLVFVSIRFSQMLALLVVAELTPAFGQSLFLNFDAPGQMSSNFGLWNDNGGVDGGGYSFQEGASAGVGGGGGISVFQSNDTTAAFKTRSWDLSANGAVVYVSCLIKANGQTSGNKVQLGILNAIPNGLNNNAGVAFESFRMIPQSPTDWSLREQYRTAGALTESVLGDVTMTPGHWYKFIVGMTNTSGASGVIAAGCSLVDFGADGLTAGANIVTFPVSQTHTAPDIAIATVWPALRAFQNGGIDAWDNFVVYQPNSPPIITSPLTNSTVVAGASAVFNVVADGPGPISFSWFTNGASVAGVSGPQYATPPVNASLTSIGVVAANASGAVTNSASVSVKVPSAPKLDVFPATAVQADTATLQGQITDTGGLVPTVIIYYGKTDGGTNSGAWANSVALDQQTSLFEATVAGLSTNSVYYFTAKASNSAGVTWVSPSRTFRTLAANPATTGVAVLTHHNNLSRTGANLEEAVLNTSNVNTNQFGLLYTLPVDDQVYAQPLIMTNVSVPGKGAHNLLIVATVNDSLYAFDADSPAPGAPLWKTSFLGPNVVSPRNSDMTGACGGGYQDFSGNLGLVGTPVIDPATGTLYVVVRTKENGSTFVQRLHAIDVTTGLDRTNSPVVITAQYSGNGAGSVNSVITFDSQRQNPRPGLALVNGIVYICWSSHCDWGPYHGWVIGYDAATLEQAVVYNDTPNGYNGGIWMSGQPPAADEAGNLYLSTGNGAVGYQGNASNLINRGESFLKLTRNGGGLDIVSWFTPFNWRDLENADADLCSGGVILIPGTTLMFSGGKQGVAYLVNRDNMGGLSGINADTNVVQSFEVTTDQIHGGPVWWDSAAGSYGYIWPASEYLQQYKFDRTAGAFELPAVSTSPTQAPFGQPGGILSLSANGAVAGSGVVWAAHQLNGDANQSVRPGILHAYDAANVSVELWNSEQISLRDSVGNFAKFCPPTVANGRVYLPTFSNRINVYGLFVPPGLSVASSGGNVVLSWPLNASRTYKVQVSPTLVPAQWTNTSATVIATNGAYQTTIPITGSGAFYRLSQ